MTLVKIYYENGEELFPLSSLDISPDYLNLLNEMGVITLHRDAISAGELRRFKRLVNLKRALGVNTIGAAVILDLLDRIEALEMEIQTLKWR